MDQRFRSLVLASIYSLLCFVVDGVAIPGMRQFLEIFNLAQKCCITPFQLNIGRIFLSLSHTGVWDAQFCHRREGSVSLSGIAAPDRPPPPAQRPVSLETTPRRPRLRTRTPSELECCQSNGALCFINPLFIKVHQPDGDNCTTSNQGLREEAISNSLETNNSNPEESCGDSMHICSSDHSDSNQLGQSNLWNLSRNSDLLDENIEISSSSQKLSTVDSVSQSPPPRPPPPRFATRRSAPPPQQCSMPEKISWINVPKEERERGSSLLSRLGSSLSISPSSSPPKKFSISSPISIPRPSLPISLSSFSSSPRRAKASPSSSQEDAQCHLALEEQTIEKALFRAKLSRCNATRTQDASSPPDPSLMTTSKPAEVTGGGGGGGGEVVKECSGGSQRLSDMSISTDSSESLDFSQSSVFFLPPLHDPSPPTEADFNIHLPLSLPPSHLPYCSMEEDDDDEDDEDEEEPDYGVSLESDQDQDQDLTMVPPGHRTKRRPSASALVLQKALRGHLRKMSGVFNSLLTPEKRAIRRVVELSRDRGSYFGCLVQDYLSYMGEGAGTQAWQGYASGLELLQTLRQFITQMKSYLRQSSELEPPIESLIPEDQIGEY